MQGLITSAYVERKLKDWKENVGKMTETIPADVMDMCDTLTFSHITGMFDREHSAGSLDSMSDKYFWRSMTLWGEFGSSWYNAVDLSLLLGIHHVVIAAWMERHGIDWLTLLRHKVGFRQRSNPSHTIFVGAYGRMHTEATFSKVHGNSVTQVRARVKQGLPVVPNRTLEAADAELLRSKKIANPLTTVDYKSYMFARCMRRVNLYNDPRY